MSIIIDKILQRRFIDGIVEANVESIKKSLFDGADVNNDHGISAAPIYCIIDNAANFRCETQSKQEDMIKIVDVCLQAGMTIDNKKCVRWVSAPLSYHFNKWAKHCPERAAIKHLRNLYIKVNGIDPLV